MNVVNYSEVLMTTIREERLENGLQVFFADESNRFFGDYHRICIVVTILCDLCTLPADNDDDVTFRSKAIATLGKELKVVKRLERMGVATADVEAVRKAMMDDFMKNSSVYLMRPDYPRSLVAAEFKKRRTHCFYG